MKPLYPPVADLKVEPEPKPPLEIVTDPAADERHRAEHEAWGRKGWATVRRLCNWARDNGLKVEC